MKNKYSFQEPECMSCPHLVTYGNLATENRYCKGFKGSKEKRFVSSDPKHKAPQWCPRRIPPVMRVYRPVEGRSAQIERGHRECCEKEGGESLRVWSCNYTQVYEMPAVMTAKEFYQRFAIDQEDIWYGIGEFLEIGDIIEFDGGLVAYQFCLVTYGIIAVVSAFNQKDTVKRSRSYESEV